MSNYLTTAQAAKLIGVSPARIKQLVEDGRLTPLRAGGNEDKAAALLFRPAEVEAFKRAPAGRPPKKKKATRRRSS